MNKGDFTMYEEKFMYEEKLIDTIRSALHCYYINGVAKYKHDYLCENIPISRFDFIVCRYNQIEVWTGNSRIAVLPLGSDHCYTNGKISSLCISAMGQNTLAVRNRLNAVLDAFFVADGYKVVTRKGKILLVRTFEEAGELVYPIDAGVMYELCTGCNPVDVMTKEAVLPIASREFIESWNKAVTPSSKQRA